MRQGTLAGEFEPIFEVTGLSSRMYIYLLSAGMFS